MTRLLLLTLLFVQVTEKLVRETIDRCEVFVVRKRSV